MKAVLLSAIAIVTLLTGCSPTSSDISGQPTPDKAISIVGGAEVNSPSLAGKVPYMVYCSIQYTDTSVSNKDFNSAEVTVNGVALVRAYRDGYYQNLGKTMTFSEGDSLEFVIKQKKIGTVKGVVYVPPSVQGVTVSPVLLGANVPNEYTSFDLSWDPAQSNFYFVIAAGYNYWETELVADSVFSTQAQSASIMLADTSGSACPYVYFRVQSYNVFPIEGFAAGSEFDVSSSYYRGNTNMPSVNVNTKMVPHLEK